MEYLSNRIYLPEIHLNPSQIKYDKCMQNVSHDIITNMDSL